MLLPVGLRVQRVGSLSSLSAVHTKQSVTPWPTNPCGSLGSEIKFWTERVVNLTIMRFMFFYFVKKKAWWILPHGKKAW